MSIFITPAQVIDKRDSLSLVLVLFVIFLSHLMLALANEPVARAVELMGQY